MNNSLKNEDLNFIKLFEMNLAELFEQDDKNGLNATYSFYRKVLIYYLSGNKVRLREFIDNSMKNFRTADCREGAIVLKLAELRLLILEKETLACSLIEDIKAEKDEKDIPLIWEGEWYFVWARIYDFKKKHIEASHYYSEAKTSFEKIGAGRKAIKSFFNSVICQERVKGAGLLHYQYIELISKARKVGEYSVVGMSMLALSQKLMDVGALRTSLEYAQRALLFLSREKGSVNYFKVLLHRAFLFYILGYVDKAKTDYQEARLSTHSEVLNAIAVLERKSKSVSIGFEDAVLPFAWFSRLHYEKNNLPTMGLQEEQLVALLLKKPTSKKCILDKIWFEQVDIEYIDLRFKKLIWRIKRKFPDMIQNEKGVYKIGSFRKGG